MLQGKTIGLVGAGNMARAVVSGLISGEYLAPAQLIASHHRPAKAEQFGSDFGIRTTTDNSEIIRQSEIVILAVKPQVISRVLSEIAGSITKEKLIITLAAGVPCASIEQVLLKETRVVRAMPNIPALVRAGMTALAAGEHATEADMNVSVAIFDAIGKTVIVEEEQLDAVTGLSGSGPAYVFLIIDALADAGVKVGLSRETSLLLAAQTVLGAATLLQETGEHPGRLKDLVTSPGGTAIAGIHTLEEGGLRTTLINAVERATERARVLGDLHHRKR